MNPVSGSIGLIVCTIVVLATGATDASAQNKSEWPVYDLPIGEDYRERIFQEHPGPAGKVSRVRSRQSVHVARVMPGQAYRLGLRLRSNKAKMLSVALYDRWPYDEGAIPIYLPTSGGLRGMQGKQEYQWWFSVDKESAGSLLYVRIAVEPGFIADPHDRRHDWRYQVFIIESPRSPMNSIGRGVVYHRGPTNLKLQNNRPSIALRYLAIPETSPVSGPVNEYAPLETDLEPYPQNNLISNGDFTHGLSGWQLQPENAKGVGVFDGKLRIWSNESAEASGVVQQIGIETANPDSLRLTMDVMIAAQTEPYRAGGPSPLSLSICYKDHQGTSHCGEKSFQKYFSIQFDDTQDQAKDLVYVRPKTWARFSFDFNEMDPKPLRLISIELSAVGAPEREAWVKSIALFHN